MPSSPSSRDLPPPPLLTHEQIETYMRDGVLVVPNMLRPPEVEEAKRGLHGTLRHRGVDPTDLTNTSSTPPLPFVDDNPVSSRPVFVTP